ncbi:hypothetical protein LZ518_07975 [Sphingomonas sp. RB56-2]|uniref:Uncharacterized protein n=1 Tax=Sphingomonas brevis TaxID=2908206 RepID=A0ABT0SAF9_9SPHN|nr:hypothetical protein [Sphingomonas brevis]MCL6741066.1 hypothetical protein [Sphingomonas brevis]
MSRWWFMVVVLIAWLVRELVIWLGFSWVAGTLIAVALLAATFLFMNRRLAKR